MNSAEQKWLAKLLNEGKNVGVVAEQANEQLRTADFIIDGARTELKSVSKIQATDMDGLSDGIRQVIKKAKGQAPNLILDVTEQVGATFNVTRRAVARYFGTGKSITNIRVVGRDFDEVLKREYFVKTKYMASYISLMLYISALEDDHDRLNEVSAFQMSDGTNIVLRDVNQEPYPDLFPRSIYCATYRSRLVDLDSFISHLRTNVLWKYPEFDTLIVQEEEKPGLDFYQMKPE
ncbi:CdiA C-terminal domain-containing protein [Chitinophaga rhizophila]|uniref:tRNA nuclease CdiA C-terminal domain-containing protein n=1 Tax=Chitinophaga rhizophila TaxID=2866212 RepID=A0ABS7GKM8_9BACT|nr:hypothetical protein [Chitinophaga rhizophila]MBW8686983.1 hypothetical protein [Chitinophaga rhizophila]